MATSALTSRTITNVSNGLTTNGQAALYPPLLEFIINQVFLSLSTDTAISAADQAVFVTASGADTSDASP